METPIPPQRGSFIAKLGAWLQLAQVIGLAGTIVGMAKAFKTLEAKGTGDSAKLSAAISEVLIYTSAGIGLAFLGLVMVTIAITACRYRACWMYRFLFWYSFWLIGLNVWLLAFFKTFTFNLHLPFGLFFLIFALVKKKEFQCAPPPKRKLPACYKLDP
jgi:hypothetical protein